MLRNALLKDARIILETKKDSVEGMGGKPLTGPDDEEDKKKLEQIVENAIPIGKVGETFSAEVSYLHFFILLIF